MIRGVSFQISQMAAPTLWEIFKGSDVGHCYWYVVQNQTEVWDASSEDGFFAEELYVGDEFLNLIKNKHYIVFLKLQMYAEPCNFKNLHTYDDFFQSNCQLILLIYDCEYVEIYSKDNKISEEIIHTAVENGYKNVCYITDENDCRTKMDIL